jgi:DNA-binding TFAR19-related protein (PDSD5 family)
VTVLENTAKKFMSKEAISRYGNLKMAHPETAIKAIAAIAQAAQLGQVKEKIQDREFKSLLIEIQKGKKTFQFKV